MQIHKVDSGLLHSCMYVIAENGHGVVIDPCADTTAAAGLTIDYLLITHEHYDHISGVNAWKAATGAPLLCSSAAAAAIPNPKKNMSRYFDVFCALQHWVSDVPAQTPDAYSCTADLQFDDRMTLDWQGHCLTLLAIPGHSAGSIGIALDGTDFFSGDSLLADTPITLGLPGGSAADWEAIGKPRIAAIPNGTRIWPGHFDSFLKLS